MGCFHKTAKQEIQINGAPTAAITKSHLNIRTRKCSNESESQFPCNSKELKQRLKKIHNNDDCQCIRVQQQQTSTTIKTSTAIDSEIYNLSKEYTNNNSKRGTNKVKHTNWVNNTFSQNGINFLDKESRNVSDSKETFLNFSSSVSYQNRFCCEHQYKQQSYFAVEKEALHTDKSFKSANNIKSKNIKSYNKCYKNFSKNNYCRCHLTAFNLKKTKKTLRNEQPPFCQCNCISTQANDYSKPANAHSASERCLQKPFSHARTSLTANSLNLKNILIKAMSNCATVTECLIRISTLFSRNCPNKGIDKCSKNIDANNKNNNHNKSEPYRGYCQRTHHLPNKTSYISEASSKISPTLNYFPSSTNSFTLHDAISSNSRCNNSNHGITDTINSITCSNNKIKGKRLNKSYHIKHNCQKSSAHSGAFNHIGQSYYNFLRNTVNFYTASSFILVLCYLTSATSAAATKSETTSIDKHPIQGIDWSKFDESSSDKEILDLLLEKKRYDKRLLPPVNDEDFCCGLSSPDMATEKNSRRPHKRGTLTVNVNVLLLSLASPDESSLKYEVEFLLNQQWNDPRLQYGNKSHYDFLNALHHHDSIWTPDTYFIMHGDFKDPIIPMHFALRIYRNGTITYAMRRHLILSCQGSLHIFPFDDPKCSFSMESISYEEAQIKYIWKNDEDTLRKSPSLTTLNAYLIKNQTTACEQNSWRGNYSCLRVDLIFTRDRAFYFTTVFIPGIILVTSSFITFWLEWNAVPARSMIGNYSCLHVELTFTRDRAYYFTTVFIPGIILVTSSFITFWLEWNAVPARVMIGVTTMLNFFTTSNGFRSTLPVVSNLTAMNVWDGVCMCFIYASLLEFVCVNYMGRKRPQHNVVYRPGENPVTQRLPAVLSRIGVILASPLEIIEREFHAALSSEKAATGPSTTGTSIGVTPTAATPMSDPLTKVQFYQEPSGGIIATAVQNLRSRSLKRRHNVMKTNELANKDISCHDYEHVYTEPGGITTFSAVPSITTTTVTIESDTVDEVAHVTEASKLRRTQSMSTNTPPLICKSEIQVDINVDTKGALEPKQKGIENIPIKPPRKKSSRSTSPSTQYDVLQSEVVEMMEISGSGNIGEKKREVGGPNEIVACTTCGGSSGSPCTHSVNNGCATETCFVQVRKKEPPHPIRIAKTIDVIARITFPTAYAIFLIFFFVHYKAFS